MLLLIGDKVGAQSIRDEILAAHNAWRAKVGTPPLTWSGTLATSAQQWAATLIQNGKFEPRRDGRLGENLLETVGGNTSPSSVVEAWASERSNYHHATNRCSARCGHYTQVVSAGSRKVGCGSARRGQREVWVCDYDPPGNIAGESPY
jgi:pathogenesis-related protein 1